MFREVWSLLSSVGTIALVLLAACVVAGDVTSERPRRGDALARPDALLLLKCEQLERDGRAKDARILELEVAHQRAILELSRHERIPPQNVPVTPAGGVAIPSPEELGVKLP